MSLGDGAQRDGRSSSGRVTWPSHTPAPAVSRPTRAIAFSSTPSRAGPAWTRRSPSRSGQFFATAHGELERLLADTSRFLSGLTDYAAVVVRQVDDPAADPLGAARGPGAQGGAWWSPCSAAARSTSTRSSWPTSQPRAQLARGVRPPRPHLTGETVGHLVAVPPPDDPVVDRVVKLRQRSPLLTSGTIWTRAHRSSSAAPPGWPPRSTRWRPSARCSTSSSSSSSWSA